MTIGRQLKTIILRKRPYYSVDYSQVIMFVRCNSVLTRTPERTLNVFFSFSYNLHYVYMYIYTNVFYNCELLITRRLFEIKLIIVKIIYANYTLL